MGDAAALGLVVEVSKEACDQRDALALSRTSPRPTTTPVTPGLVAGVHESVGGRGERRLRLLAMTTFSSRSMQSQAALKPQAGRRG